MSNGIPKISIKMFIERGQTRKEHKRQNGLRVEFNDFFNL